MSTGEAGLVGMGYRASLLVGAAGWLVSLVAFIANGSTAFDWLGQLAGEPIPYHPVLDYWLKMVVVVFTLIGCVFLYAMLRARSCSGLGLLLAGFQVVCGVTLLWAGWRTGMASTVYLWDAAWCLTTGLGIAGLGWQAQRLWQRES